ncbi:MAG: MFS transporter [Oscillospiraceae bacterium]|nr:MFS transporter [Oscillospiraceae bacterium]
MDTKQKLPLKSKISYGLGAVGKDMVYMLSASYVLYYFQDVLGVSAVAMGVILLAARIFDAFNDPIMGVVVAKTKTRWGKFRPWLLIGTLTNAVVLFLMFSCPPTLDAGGLVAYAAVTYILWGVTYTMMDIPYWSMIPAFTEGGKEREGLTTLARSCAGVGSALITVATVMAVQFLGNAFGGSNAKEIEILGFKWFSAIVAVLFIVFTILTCVNVKEKSTAEMKTVSVGQMFKALLRNDQALAIVLAIVLINSSIYITSNLVIYFFKYDFGGTEWFSSYTLFNIFGGAMQILSMMVLYPVLRNAVKLSNTKIFYICLTMSMVGYAVLLVLAFLGMGNVFVLFIPGFLIFAASGLLNILTTIFLANTVDYGELKNGSRDESVIFSLQTFVVKLASGIAAFVASICLSINKLQEGTEVSEADKLVDWSLNVSASARTGLRLTMTVIPIVVLVTAILWFRKKYILTDEKVEEIAAQVKALHAGEEQ